MNYREYNDYELLSYVNDNDEEATEIIYNKYQPLIEQSARKYLRYSKYAGLELNDLIQEHSKREDIFNQKIFNKYSGSKIVHIFIPLFSSFSSARSRRLRLLT